MRLTESTDNILIVFEVAFVLEYGTLDLEIREALALRLTEKIQRH